MDKRAEALKIAKEKGDTFFDNEPRKLPEGYLCRLVNVIGELVNGKDSKASPDDTEALVELVKNIYRGMQMELPGGNQIMVRECQMNAEIDRLDGLILAIDRKLLSIPGKSNMALKKTAVTEKPQATTDEAEVSQLTLDATRLQKILEVVQETIKGVLEQSQAWKELEGGGVDGQLEKHEQRADSLRKELKASDERAAESVQEIVMLQQSKEDLESTIKDMAQQIEELLSARSAAEENTRKQIQEREQMALISQDTNEVSAARIDGSVFA
ncbi:hypothetical protein EsH8_I_000402 [Colletotrichum jinshuiense]